MREHNVKIKRALLSVSDKSQLLELASVLAKAGIEMISTGGTQKVLRENGFETIDISEVTGKPEAFDGRMKSISFEIASSLLFKRDSKKDCDQARELGIKAIDLVVCNLYPFEDKSREGLNFPDLIEHIDIGGPTMIRAAAKNYHDVCCLTDPLDYERVMNELNQNKGELSFSLRQDLALKAFQMTARYDSMISAKLENDFYQTQETYHFSLNCAEPLRYGENPHQKGYVIDDKKSQSLVQFEKLHGKELSYNNFLDADAAFTTLKSFQCLNDRKKISVIVKHCNPCGLAMGDSAIDSIQNAWKGDPVSAFGSIIALNYEVEKDVAEFLNQYFVEVIIAPEFSPEALAILKSKKNLRLLKGTQEKETHRVTFRSIAGGVLVQEEDRVVADEFKEMTSLNKNHKNVELLRFSAAYVKSLKSNAIALLKEENGVYKVVGAGMGNPNRLISVQQCFEKARENGVTRFDDCVLASDAFFPFRDNIDMIAKVGKPTIIQPGGSIKDQEVIDACHEHNISMFFTGIRNFNH